MRLLNGCADASSPMRGTTLEPQLRRRIGPIRRCPSAPADIEAIVRQQLELETAVPAIPAPQIKVRIADATNGYVVATITYADPSSMAPVQLVVSNGG